MRVTPLADWYPDLYRRWRGDRGRRLTVPISERTGWTVHHTGGGDNDDPLSYSRWVGDWHFEQWSRPGGYNFLIPLDGSILEMCGWMHVGAHAPGCNRSTLGAAFQGSFAHRLPNDAQLSAFDWLLGSRPAPTVQQGHRDCVSTTCPGDALYRALPLPAIEEDDMTPEQDRMLREVHAALDAGKNTTVTDRIRQSLRALGKAAGLKVDPARGKPGEDITA